MSEIQTIRNVLTAIQDQVKEVVIGQDDVIENLLIALLSNGHVLVEGVPGLAKTLLVKTMAETLNCTFNRIQFTPDLMPSDVIGTKIFDSKSGEFYVKKGPVFSNIILADEVNRAPPKTQSSLLECMQEKQVTIDVESFKIPEPFFVFATQNPIEQEGTYPLPEAQVDRFLMKLVISYPERVKEEEILSKYGRNETQQVRKVADPQDIIRAQEFAKKIRSTKPITTYILDLVEKTRNHMDVMLGLSTRAALHLLMASKANALLSGRNYVTDFDVKSVAPHVMRHRIMLKPEASLDRHVEDVVKEIIDETPVP